MKLQFDQANLGRFCREHGIARLELFGSALRDDFREDSDVDLLCTLRPDVKCGLFKWIALKFDLERFFGRPVDLVSRWAIEHSRNPYRKHAVLSTSVPLYVEG